MVTQTLRCPVCERTFPLAESKSLPFCSPRCRQIDLGRWLRESYGLPIERPEDPDEPGSIARDDGGD